MDARDETSWLILELTPQGERLAEDGDLEKLLRAHGRLPTTHPIFIPSLTYVADGRKHFVSVMEGYVFVASGLDNTTIKNLLASPYVNSILSHGSGIRRTLETVPDANIRDLRKRLSEMVGAELKEGMPVKVTEGPLLGVQGKIIEVLDNQDTVLMIVNMRSLHAIREIPRLCITPVEEYE